MLELGCAQGVNLMAIAARAPDACFLGVDIDPDAIAIARRRAEAAELTNVEFQVADVGNHALDLGTHDYVVAHGVFSWIPDRARDGLLKLMGRSLSPEGMAYLSYEAKPGAGLRESLGHALRSLSSGEPEAMRDALSSLRDSPALEGTVQGVWLDAEVDAVLARPHSYVQGQFGAVAQRAFCVAEVWDWAARHGLQYLDDVAPTGLDPAAVAATRARIEAHHSDRRSVETLLDVAIMRQFRASVFVGEGKRPRAQPHQLSVQSLPSGHVDIPERPCVLPLTQVEARELGFVSTADHRHRAVHPLHALLIEHLDGSRDLDALVRVAIEAAVVGTVSIPTASGVPATAEELAEGMPVVVTAALEDLAEAGLLFEAS